ncbi:MAG: hypothetical protein WCL61_01625 [bacterium]
MKIKETINYFFLTILLLAPGLVFAEGAPEENPLGQGLDKVSVAYGNSGLTGQTGFFEIVSFTINVIIGLIGVLLFLLIIKAGFEWMTAGDDSKKIDEAKETIKKGVIGVIIMLSAYIIATFVIQSIGQVTK